MFSGMCACFLCSCVGEKEAHFQYHMNEFLKTHSGPGVSPKYVTALARASKTAVKSASLCPQSEGDIGLFINDPLKLGKLCGVFSSWKLHGVPAAQLFRDERPGTLVLLECLQVPNCLVAQCQIPPASSRSQPWCELRQASNKVYTNFSLSAPLCLARQMSVSQRHVN